MNLFPGAIYGSVSQMGASAKAAAFSPADIAGLTLWLDAAAGTYQDSGLTTPATANADLVGGWVNQATGAGVEANALQSTDLYRPSLITNGISGKKSIYFPTGKRFNVANFWDAGFKYNLKITVFAVSETTNAWGIILAGDAGGFHFTSNIASGITGIKSSKDYGSADHIFSTTGTGTKIFGFRSGASRMTYFGNNNRSNPNFTGLSVNWAEGGVIGYKPAASLSHGGYISELIVFNSVLTDTEVEQVISYLGTKYNVPVNAATKYLYFMGDSLTFGGATSITYHTGYPYQLVTAINDTGVYAHQFGVPGGLASSAKYFYITNNGIASLNTPNAVFVWYGSNDINTADSAATIYGNIQDLCVGLRARGAQSIIVGNVLIRTDLTAAEETKRVDLNNALAAGYADFSDAFVDLAANPALDDCNDATYFVADKIHLTAAGYTAVKDAMLAAYNAL